MTQSLIAQPFQSEHLCLLASVEIVQIGDVHEVKTRGGTRLGGEGEERGEEEEREEEEQGKGGEVVS